MIVMKFGGTSVADGKRIFALGSLIQRAQPRTPLVVVSALGGVTDRLIELGTLARKGNTSEAEALLGQLAARHREAIDEAGITHDAASLKESIDETFRRLGEWIRGISLLRELTPRTLDAIVSTGELLSARIVAAALRAQKLPAVFVDPREVMCTDATFGCATPDEPGILAASREKILPLLSRKEIPVTGGFVGREPSGETTTLGRGGSDYSAALFGAALGAEAIEIWTDVDGILSADPRIVSGARLVPSLSYAEAAELAFFGAKVLHPATIRPAVRRGIPVWIKNTFRPEIPGTEVREDAPGNGVRALAARKNCAAIFLSNPRMLLAHGYAARVFGVFEKLKVPVDVITTSEVSISVTVDASAPLALLKEELRGLADVEVVSGLAVVAVVGKDLRQTSGIAGRIFTALQGVNIQMISQGASNTNLTFVIDESDLPYAMQSLHQAFFEGEQG